MVCDCITCKHSRGEITTQQCIDGLKNRLEVWEIVRSYFPENGKISEESLAMLKMNISCATEEINCFLAELESKNENT